MASSPKPEKIADSPLLLSVKKINRNERVKISYRTVRGRSAKAIFAANDDVERALDHWHQSGTLEAPDRETLNEYSLEGWTAGPMGTGSGQDRPLNLGTDNLGADNAGPPSKKKHRNANDRLKEAYKPSSISPKEARLAKEAKLIAAYKDEYRGYWVVIVIVTIFTLTLLRISSSIGM